MQPSGHLRQDRHAHLPSPMRDHELDQLGRDLLSRRDEIPLVLTVLVVNHNDDTSFPEGLERIVDLREFLIHGRFLSTRNTQGAARRANGCSKPWSPFDYIHFELGVFAPHASPRERRRLSIVVEVSILHAGDQA